MTKRITFVLLAALASCGGTETTTGDVFPPAPGLESLGSCNLACPVDGNPVAPGCVTEYEGQCVGFCAMSCRDAWRQLDDCEKAKRIEVVLRHSGPYSPRR